jgi:WhiB family transcriptional regulator, redox-sensing transcriptional regulator
MPPSGRPADEGLVRMKINLDTGSGWFEVTVDVTHREGVARPDLPTARSTMVKGWAQHGTCVEAEPDALFVRGAAQQAAKKVCVGCPVIVECLADSLDNRTEFGVWGGMTERQRRALLRRRPDITSWRALFEADRTRLQRHAF